MEFSGLIEDWQRIVQLGPDHPCVVETNAAQRWLIAQPTSKVDGGHRRSSAPTTSIKRDPKYGLEHWDMFRQGLIRIPWGTPAETNAPT